jgi:hypothetical protein
MGTASKPACAASGMHPDCAARMSARRVTTTTAKSPAMSTPSTPAVSLR